MADKTITANIIIKDNGSVALKTLASNAKDSADKTRAAFRQMERSGDGMKKRSMAMAVAVGNLASRGVTSLIAMAGAGIKTGLETAASMEQAQIGFTKMMGSADLAKQSLQQITDFAATTPFEVKGLVDSTRMLMGTGVAFKDTQKIIRDFGDASAALALPQENFQRIMVAVSQSISAGKIKLGDMNQLMNNGIPVWHLMSEAMGKPVPVLQDMISHGKLLTKDVLPKLQAQMQKDYGGSMAAQSATLAGLWSTLKDTVTIGLGKALQNLTPILVQYLPPAIAALGVALQGLGTWFGIVGNFVGRVATLIGSNLAPPLQKSAGFVTNLVRALAAVGIAVKAFIVGAMSGGTAASQFSGKFYAVASAGGVFIHTVQDLWGFLKGLFNTITSSFGAVWGVFKPLIDKASGGMKGMGTTGNDLRGVMRAVGAIIKVAAGIIGGILAINLAAAMVLFKAFGVVLHAIIIPVIKAVATVFLDLVSTIIHGAAKAFGWVPGLGPKLRSAAAKFDTFAASVNRSLDGIKDETVNVNVRVRNAQVLNGAAGRNIRTEIANLRALGGSVYAGQPYVVGENGPEVIVPQQSGMVHNAMTTANMLARNGSGATAEPVVHVHIHNSVIGNEDLIARTVTDAIKRMRTRGVRYAL